MPQDVVEIKVEVPEQFRLTVEGLCRSLCEEQPPTEGEIEAAWGKHEEDIRSAISQFIEAYGDRSEPLSIEEAQVEMARVGQVPSDKYVEVDGVWWPLLGVYYLYLELKRGVPPLWVFKEVQRAPRFLERAGFTVAEGQALPSNMQITLAPVIRELQIEFIEGTVDDFVRWAKRPKDMAKAAGSRGRSWFVRCGGKLWPLKALYFLTMRECQPGRYGSPADFHTSEAREFMGRLGFVVFKVDTEGNIIESDADVVFTFRRPNQDISVLVRPSRWGAAIEATVEATDEDGCEVELTPKEVQHLQEADMSWNGIVWTDTTPEVDTAP